MTAAAHEAFVAPARARPELWRLALGLMLATLVYVSCFLALVLGIYLISGPGVAETWMIRLAQADTPTGALLLLSTFIGMALGPMAAARLLHKRPVLSLLGVRVRVVRDFGIAAMVCTAIYGLSALIPAGYQMRPHLEVTLWLSFLPLAIVGVLVQTGAEEVLFRGYLQQQLAARFASPLVWMVLPSAVFAIAHFDPQTSGANAALISAATGLFALCAADLTAKTGSLGAAWGFHFANNCVAILFVALDGPLSGLALYTTPFGPDAVEILRPLILRDMALTALTWAAIRYCVTRGPGAAITGAG